MIPGKRVRKFLFWKSKSAGASFVVNWGVALVVQKDTGGNRKVVVYGSRALIKTE